MPLIKVKVESVFEHGMVVSYTDRATGVVYYGALLPQDKVNCSLPLPVEKKRSAVRIPRGAGTVNANVTNKAVKGLKKKRRRKRRTTTTVVDSSNNVLNSCVIVCDDPNLHDTPDGKYHRYSKSKAFQKIKENKKRRKYKSRRMNNVNNAVSKSSTMGLFTEYQGSDYCRELIDLKQVHTMKPFSLKIPKVELPT